MAVAWCGFYLPDHTRYSYLLNLPEDQAIAKAIEEALVGRILDPQFGASKISALAEKYCGAQDTSIASRMCNAYGRQGLLITSWLLAGPGCEYAG